MLNSEVSINTLLERQRFYQRCQQNDELLEDYVRAVVDLASTCGFEECTGMLVRDRVLFGLCNEHVKSEIVSSGGNPSIDDIKQICVAITLFEPEGTSHILYFDSLC